MIDYGNGAQTTYEYDPLTFRLIASEDHAPGRARMATASQLFQIRPWCRTCATPTTRSGNITRIEDAALKTVFHNGQQVEPVGDYTYDAIYRLIEAKGREHIGQTAFDFNPPNGNHRDYPFVGHRAHPNDLQALRNYTERYEYDAVGNFEVAAPHRQRRQLDAPLRVRRSQPHRTGKKSNRLTRTTVGNGLNHVETYTYTTPTATMCTAA